MNTDNSITWVPGTDVTACNKPAHKPPCLHIKKPQGRWTVISSSPVGQKVKISVGTSHGYKDTTDSRWGNKVASTVSTGIDIQGNKCGVSVTGEISEQMSKSYISTFSKTTSVETEFSFPAGVVWQFQIKIQDDCGESIAGRQDLQITDAQPHPPCCLPGYFKDIKNARGDCLPDSNGQFVDLCGRPHRMLVMQEKTY